MDFGHAFNQEIEINMASAPLLGNLLGEWSGTNQLWLSPGESAYESKSTAIVSLVAQNQFIKLAYTWAFENEPQDGLIIYRSDFDLHPSGSIWLDSWHLKNEIMLCESTWDDRGVSILQGSYPAPSGPDWVWRIEIENNTKASLNIRMFNVSPEGQEALAVLAQYRRNKENL